MAKCGASAGRVLETTPGPRSTYFGAVLTGREAFMFNATEDMSPVRRLAERNLAPPAWLVTQLQAEMDETATTSHYIVRDDGGPTGAA